MLSNDSAPVECFDGQAAPVVKILQRPANVQREKTRTDRPKAPVKSLEQRELEYAQARLRILGPDAIGQMGHGRTSRIHLIHREHAAGATRTVMKPSTHPGLLTKR